MGSGTNTFILFLTISLALNLANPTSWGSPLAQLLTIEGDVLSIEDFLDEFTSILTVATISGIVAGLVLKNPAIGIAIGFATVFIGISLVPMAFFIDAEIPDVIRIMVGIPLAFLYVLSMVGWVRGVDF